MRRPADLTYGLRLTAWRPIMPRLEGAHHRPVGSQLWRDATMRAVVTPLIDPAVILASLMVGILDLWLILETRTMQLLLFPFRAVDPAHVHVTCSNALPEYLRAGPRWVTSWWSWSSIPRIYA